MDQTLQLTVPVLGKIWQYLANLLQNHCHRTHHCSSSNFYSSTQNSRYIFLISRGACLPSQEHAPYVFRIMGNKCRVCCTLQISGRINKTSQNGRNHHSAQKSGHRWPLPCLVRETGLEPA